MRLDILLLLLAAVVVVAVVIIVVVTRRPKDAVDSFRRQIDALSPEARRGVVDQVQHAAGRSESTAEAGSDDAAAPDGTEPAADATEPGDEDGARGS